MVNEYTDKTKKQIIEMLESVKIEKKHADEMKNQALETLEALRREYEQTTRELRQLRQELDTIKSDYEKLRKNYEKTAQLLQKRQNQFDSKYEVLKSFVDDNTHNIILVDGTYVIRYVNISTAQLFELPHYAAILGRRVFDFFGHKEAIKLKEKIDKVFMKGDKEKIKDIKFQNLKGKYFKIKARIFRAWYEDKPSIKLVIKED